jgi:hypothetical protein
MQVTQDRDRIDETQARCLLSAPRNVPCFLAEGQRISMAGCDNSIVAMRRFVTVQQI